MLSREFELAWGEDCFKNKKDTRKGLLKDIREILELGGHLLLLIKYVTSSGRRLHNNHDLSRTLKVTGNHVMCDRGA